MKTIIDTPSINGPIVIDVESDSKYEAIALFVDREDFLREVIEIREALKIKELIKYSDLKILKDDESRYSKLSIRLELTTENDIKDWRSLNSLTPEGINYLLQRYKKSRVYADVIRFAILCGIVNDEDFDNFPDYYRAMKQGVSISLNVNEVAFIIYPETKIEQVAELFKQYKHDLRLNDTKSNIRRDRLWYWLHKQHKSYEEIHKIGLRMGQRITRDGVIKAIQSYSSRLNMEI